MMQSYVLFSTLDNIGHFLANMNAMSSPVCLSSVTLVHPTHAIKIFCNVSLPFGMLAIC